MRGRGRSARLMETAMEPNTKAVNTALGKTQTTDYAVLKASEQFTSEQLGDMEDMWIPLEAQRFLVLTSVLVCIENVFYRAHPTHESITNGKGDNGCVFHIDPTPRDNQGIPMDREGLTR